MLTKNEITSLSLSPTKKDFVQIWNELLDVAGKLSERWDPTSTNESDPGIVILKALTGIADKLNYNIDKNTLEAFMPTAAQEDSMRKLCDMLGYNMKYYRSAETSVTIKYYNPNPDAKESNGTDGAMDGPGQLIPKFTVITNSDKDISYFTINETPRYISVNNPVADPAIPCMEGQIVKCDSINDSGLITVNQISENNRFYLPEIQIAENGLFIYNASGTSDGTKWEKVDNLNIQTRGSKVFKFGFDSYESRPYVEFPEDYSELFGEGLFIYYARTSGVNGNVSPRTLTQMEFPSFPGSAWQNVSAESISVENTFAATTGANPETITQAYNNFKKTVGTFETLVTCRDYMNKIYSLAPGGKPLVSNILATDIRSDLNRAVTLCSCDDAGIFYKETPVRQSIAQLGNMTKPTFDTTTKSWCLESSREPLRNFISSSDFRYNEPGTVFAKDGYWLINQNGFIFKTVLPADVAVDAVDHFDLILYPFKSYNQIRSNVKDIRAVYDASFTYANNIADISSELESAEIKTLSHKINGPRAKNPAVDGTTGDILCINNYLRLSATIATNSKVTAEEGTTIIDHIKIALANAFNMRELDFGEEIPFNSIVEVIENADTRIRVASLNEPALYTTFSVLEADKDNPVKTKVVEYAVASDWLDVNMADSTGRFDITDVRKDIAGNIIEYKSNTFNSNEAKKIYNKLAVRNVLAGRVPLFNYNNTFNTSFSEGSYLVTNVLPKRPDSMPDTLPELSTDNPCNIWTKDGVIYTEQYIEVPAGEADEEGNIPVEQKTVFTETRTPEKYKDNIIAENTDEDGKVESYITNIKANCKVLADDAGIIKNVTLADGEFVKFRAPNFRTTKTYPAYVNYRLELANSTKSEAVPAEASSLLSILNSDTSKWQKVLDYFRDLDTNTGSSYLKTFTLKQTVSARKGLNEKPQTSAFEISNKSEETTQYTISELGELIAHSGRAKLTNDGLKARLEWAPADGASGDVPGEIICPIDPFIASLGDLSTLKNAIDEYLVSHVDTLPTECAWTINFDFECVPFEAKSLSAWENFISTCAKNFDTGYEYQVFDYKPVAEADYYMWRMLDSTSYDIGKYITNEYKKLLTFSKKYLTSLSDVPLNDIYIIKNLGTDAVVEFIKNNTEYQLKRGERLYIEYTPSTTTDGTAQNKTAVTEVYGEGTIIRPNGFETGLYDSDAYRDLGNTKVKDVVFQQVSSTPVAMYSFGASEQVEIRELAQVHLADDTFSGASEVFIYKNFNNCPALEQCITDDNGKRINNSYTLKDGECIFYTDRNKAEYAYFTTGTLVELTGDLVLPEFDIIDLSTILDSDPQDIPWQRKALSSNNAITFQEYQYITLGSGDTINQAVLENTKVGEEKDNDGNITQKYLDNTYLDDNWHRCSEVAYSTVESPDTKESLPIISLNNNSVGNGWEACSTLELNVTAGNLQTLRSTDKVETSLSLTKALTISGIDKDLLEIVPEAGKDSDELTAFGKPAPLSFKTNLACQVCGNEISINEVYYNPNNLKGFQLKVFAAEDPVIVQTMPGKLVPYTKADIIDIASWTGDAVNKEYAEIWSNVNLSEITEMNASQPDHDNALRLPVSLLPNTYGIFCIYLDITDGTTVWIETLPGTRATDITLLNADAAKVVYLDDNQEYLSKLYLNAGINCIRVNKTGRLFVKASKNAEGMLYFDELRLVNSQVLEYIGADNEPVPVYTNGLNLNTIGYLGINTNTSDNTLSATARAAIQVAQANSAYSEMQASCQEMADAASKKHAELLELLPKVSSLVEAETVIRDEFAVIQSLADERLSVLVDKYNEISTALENENALLAALNGNVQAEELEQQLATLLASFSTAEITQQQVLEEFAKLRTAAVAECEDCSNKDIIADFNAIAVNNQDAFKNVVSRASGILDDTYADKLTEIANSLDGLVNSGDKTKIQTILAELRSRECADTNNSLVSLANRLSSTLDFEAIGNILTEMSACAAEPDYVQLYALTTELIAIIETRGLPEVVEELVKAAENSDSAQLAGLTDELEALVAKINTTETGTLRAAISELATLVKGKVDKGTTAVDATITSKVQSINEAFILDYKNSLNSIIAKIRDCLDNLAKDTTISSLINNFAASESTQAAKLAEALKAVLQEYAEKNETLTNLTIGTWSTSTVADIMKTAILAYWPMRMQTRLVQLMDSTEAIFDAALQDSFDAFDTHKGTLDKLLSKKLNNSMSDVLLKVANAEAIANLFSRVKSVLSTNKQTGDDIKLISEIRSLVQNSDELTTALTNVGSNAIITTLVDELKSVSSIRQKQAIQLQLEEALTSAIGVNKQLFSVISSLLCPVLTAYEAKIDPADQFYTKLASAIADNKKQLQAKAVQNLSMSLDNAALELLETPYAKLTASTLNAYNAANSLLPQTFADSVTELAALLTEADARKAAVKPLSAESLSKQSSADIGEIVTANETINEILKKLHKNIAELEQHKVVDDDYEEAFSILDIEEQLLREIRATDINREFYYNVAVPDRVAIELNDSDRALNTLMNPAVNYDVNNVNNNFVISKLDIGYLDSGIQIARSSKLS